jgi:hypothetical protein
MMSYPFLKSSLAALLVPVLAFAIVFAGPGSSEAGGSGNGNGNSSNAGQSSNNGNQQNGGQRGNSGTRGNSAANSNAPQANVAAGANGTSMPQRLSAYKSAYLEAQTALAEATRYQGQYQAVSAMTEADFLAAYPGADYRATLNHLAESYNAAMATAQSSEAEVASLLDSVTGGQPLTPQGLADLHQMLGL